MEELLKEELEEEITPEGKVDTPEVAEESPKEESKPVKGEGRTEESHTKESKTQVCF